MMSSRPPTHPDFPEWYDPEGEFEDDD